MSESPTWFVETAAERSSVLYGHNPTQQTMPVGGKNEHMRILDTREYDLLLVQALRSLGLTKVEAQRLLAVRWPMTAVPGLLNEASGRGLIVTPADVADWLNEVVGPSWSDGEPVDPQTTLVTPRICDRFLAWAVETGRARPSAIGKMMIERPHVLERLLEAAEAETN